MAEIIACPNGYTPAALIPYGVVFATADRPDSRLVMLADGALVLSEDGGKTLRSELFIYCEWDLANREEFAHCKAVPNCLITCTFGTD